MDVGLVKLEARLAAIEYLLAYGMSALYAMIDVPHETVLSKHSHVLNKLQESVVADTTNPAFSDLMVAETADAVLRLLRGIEETMGIPRELRSKF